jgi:hypothetical protein
MLGSNAPSTNSMEANIRRMNAANAKNNMIGGPKMMGRLRVIKGRNYGKGHGAEGCCFKIIEFVNTKF